MTELVFLVEDAPEGGYTARALAEAIFPETERWDELEEAVRDAVRCHFDRDEDRSVRIRLRRVCRCRPPKSPSRRQGSRRQQDTPMAPGNTACNTPGRGNATVPAAVSGASRPRFGQVTIRDRGRLPHWEAEGAIYFVTFRLADSLPRSVLQALQAEGEDILNTAKQMGRQLSPAESKHLAQLSNQRIEAYLDSGRGACHLRNRRVAQLAAAALRHFDGECYRLFAWCVMPNHVHVVFRPLPNHTLAEIVQTWKSYTAKRANRILHRTGAFWQREYYDHLVRNEAEFQRIVQYVIDNPAKARLSHWPSVWASGQDAPTTGGQDPSGTPEK